MFNEQFWANFWYSANLAILAIPSVILLSIIIATLICLPYTIREKLRDRRIQKEIKEIMNKYKLGNKEVI